MRSPTFRQRVIAMSVLAAAGTAAVLMARISRLGYTITGDCAPPPGYEGGGYRCDVPITDHPYFGIAILIGVVGLVAALLLWAINGASITPVRSRYAARRARLWLVNGVMALVLVGFLVLLALQTRSSSTPKPRLQPRIQGPPIEQIALGEAMPFAGAVKTTLDEAAEETGRPALLPNAPEASGSCIAVTWIAPNQGTPSSTDGEVVVGFSTGVEMDSLPPPPDGHDFAAIAKQIGSDAKVVDLNGFSGLAIQATQFNTYGSVELDKAGSDVVLYGRGLSFEGLTELGKSVDLAGGQNPVPCSTPSG
jgi:hypothetical protein